MQLTELKKQLKNGDVKFSGHCHDCGTPVNVTCSVNENNELVISGGAIYNPKFGTPSTEHIFFKCDGCFQKDRTLRNFAPCEVYSRVVGYLRPVSGWNKGKIEEWKQRKEFVVG